MKPTCPALSARLPRRPILNDLAAISGAVFGETIGGRYLPEIAWLHRTNSLRRGCPLPGQHNYKTAAKILYDLREAVGGYEGDRITR